MSELFFYLPGIFLILCQLWNELKLGVSFHKTHPFVVRSAGVGLEMHPTQWMVNNLDITVVASQVPDFTSLTCFSTFPLGWPWIQKISQGFRKWCAIKFFLPVITVMSHLFIAITWGSVPPIPGTTPKLDVYRSLTHQPHVTIQYNFSQLLYELQGGAPTVITLQPPKLYIYIPN